MKGGVNSVLLRVGGTINLDDFKTPKAPYDWAGLSSDTVNGETTFDKLNKP